MPSALLTARDHHVAKSSPLFRLLKPAHQTSLLDSARILHYLDGQVIKTADVLMVLSGHVRLSKHEICIEVIGPGEIFGESSLFLGAFPLDVRAVEATTLAALRITVAEEEHEILCALAQLTAKMSVDAAKRLHENRTLTGPQRVVRYIFDLWIQQGRPDGAFRLPFKKSVLADHLGLAPEALSRALQLFRQSSFVVRDRFVQVIDPNALIIQAGR